jgi:tetratricopeptide (TPR) repeat protein
MELSRELQQAIKAFNDDPANAGNVYKLGAAYWSTVLDTIGNLVRENGDLNGYLDEHRDFLDFGLLRQVREDHDEVRAKLREGDARPGGVKVVLFTDWLKETIARISEGDRIEFLKRDINESMARIKRFTTEIGSLQEARGALLGRELSGAGDAKLTRQIERMSEYDELVYDNLKRKKAIARGVFFSVDERRSFVEGEKRLQKMRERNEALGANVQSTKARAELHTLETQIADRFAQIIDTEENIKRLEGEIGEIEQKQDSMSPIEMESRARREIEYLRDLVKLSAKRLRVESCPISTPGQSCLTPAMLRDCFDRVLEFDPRIFCNDRVPFMGKPSVLLVPGNGNALYDWKNNRFVVPMVPPGKNFMAAVATGVIEYRLDVDEDKKLLNSYNKLPALKNVRSLFQLRASLTKDYIVWMTSEYQGFKVLRKETRQWFEHEVAPRKQEIYCPPGLEQFNMSTEEYQKLLKAVESRLTEPLRDSAEHDLWTASILYYQQGMFDRSYTCLEALLENHPDHEPAWYNLGHVAMKLLRKQDAIRGFQEYSKRRSQSWWTAVAREHIRRLQTG